MSEVTVQETLLARAWRMLADVVENAGAISITTKSIRNLADKLEKPITKNKKGD